MDKFVITGGKALKGKVTVSGAKNAALAIMPAALLNSGENVLHNTPEVNDVYTMIKLLDNLGVKTDFKDFTLKFDTSNITSQVAPYEHVKKMRASVYVLGPLLSRFGYAKVSLPGGCAWGPRPINLHLEGLKKMGADIELDGGYIIAKASKLQGARISFDVSSVGATGNLMMAATLAKGTTLITNAAIEPEITALAEYLVKMGAKINGINTSVLEIQGVDELKAAETTNIPDRIEAGTLLIAGALTRGNVELMNVSPGHLNSVLVKLEDSGVKMSVDKNCIKLDASNLDNIRPVDVSTSIYPGFPTDMQAQWTAFMSIASGVSTVTDSIYLDRFKHVPELNRLGADIEIRENSVVIHGVPRLKGAKVMSTDLRASASLVLAGLAAEGETEVLRIYHLDRGYQRIEEKLISIGAQIERVAGAEY
ncbi:MAG: UDP-N-acetylglucosamine 1-carboxyvinyltransferase [Ignavibacteria bacterium]|nr:UDP-N-acetylglucosamine 1-carboxyvinyltransferase [Ignavibacteria bacterium]MCU7505050.1 UDP-N-acetylglucosamine 1-carboxyvinyltransferase [Ignavibacteria bacterium]MCU7515310.1 UDP-N-acetylglucosamine 1-carboxyvinyltransferase [Ignavibacteria bacterium]